MGIIPLAFAGFYLFFLFTLFSFLFTLYSIYSYRAYRAHKAYRGNRAYRAHRAYRAYRRNMAGEIRLIYRENRVMVLWMEWMVGFGVFCGGDLGVKNLDNDY